MSDHRRTSVSSGADQSVCVPIDQTHDRTTSDDPPGREMLFIDAGLHDWSKIEANVRPDVDIVVFDPKTDPLTQIIDALACGQASEAVHIASRGDADYLHLGKRRIKLADLPGRSTPLSALRGCLVYVDDAVLYGCEFATPAEAEAFLQALLKARAEQGTA